MKRFDMFDQTPPHTLDKIMAKLVQMKNDLKASPSAQRSRSEQKVKDNILGNKNMPPLKKIEQGFPSN